MEDLGSQHLSHSMRYNETFTYVPKGVSQQSLSGKGFYTIVNIITVPISQKHVLDTIYALK